MMSLKLNVLGYQIYADDLSKIRLDERLIINTINGHSYAVAKKDLQFQEALLSSDVLLPDGVSVTFGVRMENGIKIPKIAGFDIFIHLLKQLNKKNGSCFFLGALPNTLLYINDRIQKEFPNIRVGFFSPPFVEHYNLQQTKEMCKIINDFNPDVLFVGMTAPKQEKWVFQNKTFLKSNIICSIGAVFDFYARTKKRPAAWMINIGMEWFGRFLSEPVRLFYRYFISTPTIFIDILLKRIHRRSENIHRIEPFDSNEIGNVSDLDFHLHYKLLDKQYSKKIKKTK